MRAKGRITYVEEDGKITSATVELNPDKIKPGRNDYQSTEGSSSDPLKASEDVINTALNTAFARAGSSGIHQGWNEPAIGTLGRFHCETMPLSGIAVVIVDVGVSIYESAALPGQIWNEPPGTTAEKGSYPIHGPPVVCGVADGVIEEVTEIPQLVKMGVDLASSPEAVQSLVASIAGITPAKIKELAQSSIKEKWESYTGDPQVMAHTGGKDGVVVASMLMGIGSIKEIASKFNDAIQKTGEAISRGLDDFLRTLYNKLKNKELFPRLQDALNDPALKDLLTSNPDLVKAWELLTENANSKLTKHGPSIEKVFELLSDSDFLAKLGGESKLKEILRALANPLNDGTQSKLVNIVEHLSNLKALVKNHSGAEGFDRLMNDLKNTNIHMQDGVSHMLEAIKNFPPGSIKKFDYEFEAPGTVCTKCRFDIELDPGPPRLIEYKSWSLEYIPYVSVKQLTEYFGNVSSTNEM